MPNTILILGAGHYQLPLIKKANELGYRTVVCSIPGDYPGLAVADKWCRVSTIDIEGCLRATREEKVAGIISCGNDTVMPTVGYINDTMGLCGPSLVSAMLAADKAAMKKAFLAAGVRTASYFEARDVETCRKAAEELGYPAVLKVVDSCGSKGVQIVRKPENLKAAYAEVSELSDKPYIIIEEFLDGTEFGAQAFVENGKFSFVLPHGDILFQGATGVPIGHYAPCGLSEMVVSDCIDQLGQAVKALGIDNAPINADFILHEGKVYVLEIAPRVGSTLLPELVTAHMGVDYYAYILRKAMGESVSFDTAEPVACAVEVLISERSGTVKDIQMPETNGNILQLDLICKEGDRVRAFANAFDRIGHLVVKGVDLKSALGELSNAKTKINLTMCY